VWPRLGPCRRRGPCPGSARPYRFTVADHPAGRIATDISKWQLRHKC